MSNPKVVFITGLPDRIVEVVLGFNPEGWTTEIVRGDTPLEDQMRAVAGVDFIMVYRANLHDDVLRAAENVRVVQTLAAGYDSMNLKLMRDLEVACCNNGGANSLAVADHAVLLMLTLYKQLLAADRSVRAGGWSQPDRRLQHVRDDWQSGRNSWTRKHRTTGCQASAGIRCPGAVFRPVPAGPRLGT